jgi:hypothetical protein
MNLDPASCSNCDTASGHLHGQDLAAGFRQSATYTLLSAALDQEKHTPATARAADLGAE